MGFLQSSWLFPILVILSFSFSDNSCAEGKCLNDQRALLLQLNHSLLSDFSFHDTDFHHSSTFLSKRSTWDLNTDCCSSWYGITCDSDGHVISLDLSSDGIISGLNDSSSLFNLRYLKRLNLAENQYYFNGSLPASISKLNQLQHLDLSDNSVTAQLIEFINGSKLNQLQYLDLSYNSFIAELTEFFNGLKLNQLQYLDLSHNYFTGQLGNFCIGSPSQLRYLDLSNNQLQGRVPVSIFEFSELNTLRLGSNNFSNSDILDVPIHKWRNLNNLDLSNIRLTINTTNANFALFPQMERLFLSSCDLREFPTFLENQSQMFQLDLSSNQIRGKIPNWMGKIGNKGGYGLTELNVSNNFLEDPDRPLLLKSDKIDFHSNLLEGKNPISTPSAYFLDYSFNNFTSMISNISFNVSDALFFSISNNQISGEIPTSICEGNPYNYGDNGIKYLDLSHNKFSGEIPHCLLSGRAFQKLRVLNLRRNNLQGIIPDIFPESCKLERFELNGNKLEGYLPRSLANCTTLKVLDVGNNGLMGNFPDQLGNMPQLRVLVLRSNKLYGPWGSKESECNFPMLQIIDVSFNNFSGIISKECFSSWNGMMVNKKVTKENPSDGVLGFGVEFNDINYQDMVTITLKGVDMEVGKILDNFTTIDFSNNQFEGEIPESIGNLTLLYTLNLSRNALTGSILSNIGNLTHLESLDLSRNKLIGEIPFQLAGLSSLAVLNLSYNKLVGKIPSGSQFQTFDSSAFEGNDELCGFPLTKNCTSTRESPTNVLGSKEGFDWILFAVTFLGFVVGASMVIGPQYFWKKGREWVNERINKILNIA